MGQYILFSLTHNIKVEKQELDQQNINKENMLEALNKEVDTALYDLIELENSFELRAKEELFNKKVVKEFLEEQFAFFDFKGDKLFSKLDSLDSYEDIVNFAKDKSFQNFQEQKGDYKIRFGHWKSFKVSTTGIIFFMEGKAYLECYSTMFDYIRKLIIKNSNYKISNLVQILLE